MAAENGLPAPCRFGYEEHDGARYCFEHGGFLEAGSFYSGSRRCDRAWLCSICGFDAKRFEPRAEGRFGAMRYHMALHEAGRVFRPELCEAEETDQATRGRAPAENHVARVRAAIQPTKTFETEETQ